MGTIAQKGAYLNDTKSELKQAINNLGGSITDETTFRQYVNQLDGVYDVLPKTSFQEGTDVTIEGGLKGKIDFDTQDGKKVVGYGDTEQDGEPTPSTPVSIQCVTGNQDVVVSGKNLWGLEKRVYTPQATQDVTASINNGKLTASGTSNAHTSYSMSVVTGEKYTIIWKNATGLNSVQVKDGQDGTQYFRNYNTTGLEVITTRTDTLFLNILSSGTTLTIEDVMVVKGEYTSQTIGDYEPYHTPITYPISLGNIELCKIGDYADELLYDVENDKVYKNENVGKYIFTGNEGWTQTGARQDTFYLPHEFFDIYINQLLLSNIAKFKKYINATSEIDETGSYIYINQNAGYVYFQFPNISTLTEFKNVIQNSFAIYIQEPTLTEITDTTLINQVKALYNAHSNNGTTIIESNGDLPMIIKVRALKGE